MKFFTILALIPPFCGVSVMPNEVLFNAITHVGCDDGTQWMLIATGNSTSDACQKNLNVSPIIRLVKEEGLNVVIVETVRKNATYMETAPNSDFFVYKSVNEVEKGELKGTTMTTRHEYENLDHLIRCGGSKLAIKTPDKSVKVEFTFNGQTVYCKGSVIVVII